MRIPVSIPALSGHDVALQTGGLGKPKLLVDGRPHTASKGVVTIERPGQLPVHVRLKQRFPDPIPALEVDGHRIDVVPPLQWYHYTWCCIPLILILRGGVIGGLVGGAAAVGNIALFRAFDSPAARWIVTGAVTFAAITLYVLLALMLVMVLQPAP